MFFDKHHFFLKIFRSYHKALLKKFTFSFYLIRYYDWCWMSQTPFWAIHKSNLVLRKRKKKLDKTISNCMKTKCYTRSNLFKYKILSSKLVALLTHVPPTPLTPIPPSLLPFSPILVTHAFDLSTYRIEVWFTCQAHFPSWLPIPRSVCNLV